MAHFEKGSHVLLLFLSCFVSWSKTTALLTFFHEVSGINVSDRLIKLYEGKDREESEALAYEVSCQIAFRIGEFTDGFYLMTPFSRTELMSRIIRTISEY